MHNFLKLVAADKFPMENIAYALFNDLVTWLTVENCNLMRYSPITLRFWRTGRQLLKRKLVRSMSGPKLVGAKEKYTDDVGEYKIERIIQN